MNIRVLLLENVFVKWVESEWRFMSSSPTAYYKLDAKELFVRVAIICPQRCFARCIAKSMGT